MSGGGGQGLRMWGEESGRGRGLSMPLLATAAIPSWRASWLAAMAIVVSRKMRDAGEGNDVEDP